MTVLTLHFADLSAQALYRSRSCWVITVLLFVLAITFGIWVLCLALQSLTLSANPHLSYNVITFLVFMRGVNRL